MLLQTPRLTLRPPTEADLDVMCEAFADPEVMHFIGDGAVVPRDRVELALSRSRRSIEETGLGAFIVVDRDTGSVCGDCLLQKIPLSGSGWKETGIRGPDIEVGYRLAKAWWNQGIATEAGRRILQHAFDPAGANLERVVAVTAPEHIASQRVLGKIGMKAQGFTDRYYDQRCALFEITRSSQA